MPATPGSLGGRSEYLQSQYNLPISGRLQLHAADSRESTRRVEVAFELTFSHSCSVPQLRFIGAHGGQPSLSFAVVSAACIRYGSAIICTLHCSTVNLHARNDVLPLGFCDEPVVDLSGRIATDRQRRGADLRCELGVWQRSAPKDEHVEQLEQAQLGRVSALLT